MSQNISKAQAALELSDELTDIELKLERAELLLSDMADDYFRPLDASSEEGKFRVCFEHPRYEIITNIITDYLFAIRKDLQALAELQKEASTAARAGIAIT